MIADDMTWQEIKRKVDEMANMDDRLLKAHASRYYWQANYWEAKFGELKFDVAERYVKLPLDADGEPINVGDSVEFIGGEDGKVVAVELDKSGWSVSVVPAGWDTPTLQSPSSLLRRYERTVEDVLCEFSDAVSGQNDDFASLVVKKYADEIRQMLDD